MGRRRCEAERLKVQLWALQSGQKLVLLFKGRDAAGKGGAIKRESAQRPRGRQLRH